MDDNENGCCTETEPTADELAAWPNCATPDCQNKTCKWSARPDLCHPCGVAVLGDRAMDMRFAETHPDHPTFQCAECLGTFPLNTEFDPAAEYALRFGNAPRDDNFVCDDCYKKILDRFGHCATCLDKPCSCVPH